ncbi:MAG: hypothetical protein KDD34_09430, partial [Bdellovibrionales bacterium]|nr:hypothetical protein [Bdellovibrionales bacterium]
FITFTFYSPIVLSEEFQRSVNLEWEPVEGATMYEVQIVRILENGKKKAPVTFSMESPLWQATINYGKYELSLRSYDDRSVPGDWSDPMEFLVRPPPPDIIQPQEKSTLSSNDDNREKVTFAWKPVSGAKSYQLKVSSVDGATNENISTESTSHSLHLSVAKEYAWKVIAVMKEGDLGEEAESPHLFRVLGTALQTPQIEKPVSKFVQELEWNKPSYAESFDYALYRQDQNKRWHKVSSKKNVSENKIKFDLSNPSGQYQLKVIAKAQNRKPSSITSLEFPVEGDLRTPAAVEAAVLKDSLRKPTHFYAIASYFITQMNYENIRYESDSGSQFNEIGGTGRIGLGYQNPFYNWGTYGVIDLSGINIKGQNYTFASAELHETWKLNFQSANLFLISGGLYMKELPEIIGNNKVGVQSVEKAQNIGSHAGFKFWMPFSQKLGMQMNGRIYYSLLGSAPNGQDITPTLSYQLGVLGSLRLRQDLMGFAGYAYRLDQTQYAADPSAPGSRASEGDINTIKMQGHYLNLLLEYSF